MPALLLRILCALRFLRHCPCFHLPQMAREHALPALYCVPRGNVRKFFVGGFGLRCSFPFACGPESGKPNLRYGELCAYITARKKQRRRLLPSALRATIIAWLFVVSADKPACVKSHAVTPACDQVRSSAPVGTPPMPDTTRKPEKSRVSSGMTYIRLCDHMLEHSCENALCSVM